VAERLRETAEQLAVGRIHLLGQEPDVVGVADRPLEGGLGTVDLAGERLGLGEPEGA
jgi:hypothetical protein